MHSERGWSVDTATADGFRDFWFEGLEVGKYALKTEAPEFIAKTTDSISTEKDVNLGDIKLSQIVFNWRWL